MEKVTEPQLLPCLSGEAISRQPLIQPLLLQLKSLISAPPDVYQQLYLATFTAFAEFCQAMPFDVKQPEPYSLLKRQLELAVTALKLRRGYMLPQHSESESIAEQEPLWTYAVFTVCLLTGLARLQTDRAVNLYLNNNEKLGQWSVLAGTLYEPKTYYTITARPNHALIDSSHCMALLVGKLIPSYAMRWLASYPDVFDSWWQAITSGVQVERNDSLMGLIKKAIEEIEYPLHSEKLKAIKKPAASTLEDFTVWLEQQYQDSDNDSENNSFLRVTPGLFIESKRIDDFLSCYPQYSSQEHLLENLHDYLLEKNHSVLHRYRPDRFENRLILEGIILQVMYLPDFLKSLPIQSNFVSEIPL
ncbi:MAG TPA: TraI domain-containing protein [Gammaproteobacteria bacterium]|nr:TraI domain-containing protein [Gammaproteobacteria bacterium]